jgi:hypothetical protein
MKKARVLRRGALIFGAVVFSVMMGACQIPSAEPSAPRQGKGGITVSIGIDGAEYLPAESLLASPARTVVPDFSGTPFSKYTLNFTPTMGGAVHDPVSITGGTTAEVDDLAAGTYTVTVTGYTGSDVFERAAAVGSTPGVEITEGGTTQVSITLGPKPAEAGETGSFAYDITVPSGVNSAQLIITTAGGGDVSGGTINLFVGANASQKALAPGYYRVQVLLIKGGQTAGLTEIIHIYNTLPSALPAVVFDDSNFADPAAVSAFALTGYFAAPVTGAAPVTTFTGDQYTGAISWSPSPGSNFAASQVYTATVTLTAKAGYTFTGVAANVFSHGSVNGTSSAGGNVVTLGFPVTDAAPPSGGSLDMSISFDSGEVTVTGDQGTNTIVKGGSPSSLNLSVTGFSEIAWYLNGNSTALSAANPLVLNAADYGTGTYSVSFTGKKDGIPYGKIVPFTVTQETPPPADDVLTYDSLAAMQAGLTAKPVNTADNPYKVALTTISISDLGLGSDAMTGTNDLYDALALAGRYVEIDIEDMNSDVTVWGTGPRSKHDGTKLIVGITLPTWLTKLDQYVIYNWHELKWVKWPTAPAGAIVSDMAIRNNLLLEKVQLPETITSIGKSTLRDNPELKIVILPAETVPPLGVTTFTNSGSDYKVYVPDAKVTEYQNATNWSSYSANIVGISTLTDPPENW